MIRPARRLVLNLLGRIDIRAPDRLALACPYTSALNS